MFNLPTKRNLDSLISIIIPTYNRAHLIGETLDSVIAQTYINWECVVVDDGSTDYTAELLKFYSEKDDRILFFHRPQDHSKGANSCRNYGFKKSKGDYIQWLDSDDLLIPEGLKIKISCIENSISNISICRTGVLTNHKSSSVGKIERISPHSNLLLLYLSGKVSINTPSVLWKRYVVKDFEFDEDLSRAQELDFYFRIFQNSVIKASFIDETLVLIRNHEDSLTGAYNRGDLNSILSELKVRRKTLTYVFENAEAKEDKFSSLNIYLRGIRRLYKSYSIFIVMQELKKIETILPLKTSHLKWKYYLLTSLLFYKITGREFQLKTHLFQLKKHLML